jgi:hypothetical protein
MRTPEGSPLANGGFWEGGDHHDLAALESVGTMPGEAGLIALSVPTG